MDDLRIEEIIDGGTSNGSFLELLVQGRVFRILYIAFISIALLFAGRVFFLGQYSRDFYAMRALANVDHGVPLPAGRGIVFDRYGIPIAQNQPIFSVSVRIPEFLAHRDEIESFLGESIGVTKQEIETKLSGLDLEKDETMLVARDLDPEELLKLKTRNLPGIEIHDDFRRYYPTGELLAQALGYADFEGNGRTGLELYYDAALKGTDGMMLTEKNSKGETLTDMEVRKPIPGKSLTTTIDLEFQKYFVERLAQGLAALGRKSGAGLAIDPRTGEILAVVSLPSFDSNLFTKKGSPDDRAKKAELLVSSEKPLFNRAIAGIYNPGSTIKPLHALAGLSEGVITTETKIFSPGYIDIPNPYFPDKPSRFVDWRPQGWVDVHSALAKSSNVYFYEVGGGYQDMKGLGIERLNIWWQKFGFGKPTGIDYPGEGEGFLPDPEEKEARTGIPWRIGDTYNVSIGQGDLMVSPLQLLTQIDAIANGGKLMRPHLNKEEVPIITADYSDLKQNIEEVRLGMRDTVTETYGTAYLLHTLPFPVAAKTGSAQVQNNTKTNAFFVGFAPYAPLEGTLGNDPKIAIIVLVEDAKEGSLNVVPIANDLFYWYYVHRLANGQAQSATDK